MRQLALDIEATPDDPANPDFDAPETWTIWAVNLSFRADAQTTPETTVLIRRSDSARHARQLLAAVANWILDKSPVDALLTYNGESYDMPILNHHIDEIESHDEELAAYICDALSAPHRDLFAEIVGELPESEPWPSLSSALTHRQIQPATTTLDGDLVDGEATIPLGEKVLSDGVGALTASEKRAVIEYGKSDVIPLHPLSIKLDEERRERIEAESAAITQTGQSATNTGGER